MTKHLKGILNVLYKHNKIDGSTYSYNYILLYFLYNSPNIFQLAFQMYHAQQASYLTYYCLTVRFIYQNLHKKYLSLVRKKWL